jgi:hypothetical protein
MSSLYNKFYLALKGREMSEVDEVAQQPLFDSEAARLEAARGLGIEVVGILPAVGVVIGGVEPAHAIDEPPKITDAEWELIRPLLDKYRGIRASRVCGREFMDTCLYAAKCRFQWTLLEAYTANCEACRKRSERMCLSAVNRWAELLDAVGDQMRHEVYELLLAWKLHGNGMRNRVAAKREKARRDLLTK